MCEATSPIWFTAEESCGTLNKKFIPKINTKYQLLKSAHSATSWTQSSIRIRTFCWTNCHWETLYHPFILLTQTETLLICKPYTIMHWKVTVPTSYTAAIWSHSSKRHCMLKGAQTSSFPLVIVEQNSGKPELAILNTYHSRPITQTPLPVHVTVNKLNVVFYWNHSWAWRLQSPGNMSAQVPL